MQGKELNTVMHSSVMDFTFILDLASNGNTSQSSRYSDILYGASNAIDGITEDPYCSHTLNETNPFLQIDLATKAEVFEITVFNRIHKTESEINFDFATFLSS